MCWRTTLVKEKKKEKIENVAGNGPKEFVLVSAKAGQGRSEGDIIFDWP